MVKTAKVKKPAMFVCNGCGFETPDPNANACPGCGHDTKPIYRKLETSEDAAEEPAEEAGPKPHKHSYRKNGTCACGQVRKVRTPR